MKIHNHDTELEELLDCPFCGERPIAYLQGNEFTTKKSITVKCPHCLVQRTTGTLYHSSEWLEEKVIQLWNIRSS